MTVEKSFEKIKAMPDSDLKMAKMFALSTSLGMFNKFNREPLKQELHRLYREGYRIRTF